MYNVATGVATNLDPGLWTGPCHGLDCGLDSRPLSLLNSLQVAQKRKEPGACSLKIAHDNDLYACNTLGWSCDYGCVRPCNVFGALGLIYWGSYARVEA